METLIVVGTVAVVAASVVFLIARQWPTIFAAPRVDPAAIRSELVHHPPLRKMVDSRMDPRTETGLGLTLGVGAVVSSAAAVGILLAMIRSRSGLAGFDLRLARFGADHATTLSTTVMRQISVLGGAQGVIILAAIVAIIEYRRWRNLAIPAFLALVVLGQFAVANLTKLVVDRARPNVDRLTGFSGSSFPSGHAVAAASSFAAFAFLIGRRRSLNAKAVLAGIAGAVATAVGVTRIFLGVHWFTDVLAGLFIGWGWFALCSIAFGGRLLRFGAPLTTAESIAQTRNELDSRSAGSNSGSGP